MEDWSWNLFLTLVNIPTPVGMTLFSGMGYTLSCLEEDVRITGFMFVVSSYFEIGTKQKIDKSNKWVIYFTRQESSNMEIGTATFAPLTNVL